MDKAFGIFEISFQYNRQFVNATLYLEAYEDSPNDFRIWVNADSFEQSLHMTKRLVRGKHNSNKIVLMEDKIANWIRNNVENRHETATTGVIDLNDLCILTRELLPQHYSNYLRPFIHAIYALFGGSFIQISDLPSLYDTYVMGPAPPHQDTRKIIDEAYKYWQSAEIKNKIYATLYHDASLEINEKKQQVLNEYARVSDKLKAEKKQVKQNNKVQLAYKRSRDLKQIDQDIEEERKTKWAAYEMEKTDMLLELENLRKEKVALLSNDPSIRAEAVVINMVKESPASPREAPELPDIIFNMPFGNHNIPSYLKEIKK